MKVIRKKIGLALGAGGAKGLAHIGVLQVLSESDIPIDMIAGASMGAAIGAFYAAGSDPVMLGKLACHLNQSFFIDVAMPRFGLLKGEKMTQILRLLTHNKTFDQLQIPLAVVATDIERGQRVVLQEGDVALAVRASSSIPGIFKPIRINDCLLVDGAVTERLPVTVLKEMGADFIIGVDVKNWPAERMEVNNIYEVIMQSIEILEKEVCRKFLEMADFLICPNLSNIGTLDFQKAEECVQIGREAALASLPQLQGALLALGVVEGQVS